MESLLLSGAFVLLPATSALLLFSSLLPRANSCKLESYGFFSALGWREASAVSATAVVLWAAFGVCVLSALHSLSSPAFLLWWTIALALSCSAWISSGKPSLTTALGIPLASFQNIRDWSWLEKSLLAILGASLAGSLAMGVFSPPNNGDVLIYHLPRQLVWISQGTVFPEFMPYGHMQKMPPLTEWLGLNFYLLTGGDRWHFLVQWLSLLFCLVFISAILRELGGNRKTQLLGCVFFASLPAAFFQASNSKNDLFLAASLLGCSWIGEKMVASRKMETFPILLAGIWAGLGILAKGTALAYLPIVAFLHASRFLFLGGKIRFLPLAAALTACALIGSPHYAYQAKEILSAEISPSDPGKKSDHANGKFSAATGASVLLRNYTLQMSLPWEPWNRWLEKTATRASESLGIGINDPDSTFGGQQFAVQYYPTSEDVATGFLHFLLPVFLLCGGFFFISPGKRRNTALLYAAAFLLSLALFSFLFRWQLWHSRLMIPAVALAAPGIGFFFASLRAYTNAVLCALLLLWLAPSFSSWARPLFAKSSVFSLPEDGLVGRSNGASVFLTSIGKTLRALGASTVYLDITNAPIHAALRYLPPGCKLHFPRLPGDPAKIQSVITNLPDAKLAPETLARTEGKRLVFSLEGWRVWIDPSLLENTGRIAKNTLPAFFQISPIAGTGSLQGPYPDHGVPVFANAYDQGSSFLLPPTDSPNTLAVSISRFEGPCSVEIFLDDEPLGSLPLDEKNSQLAKDFPLPTNPFPSVLTLLPDRSYPSIYDPRPVSFRLQKLQVLPPEKTKNLPAHNPSR